MVSVYFRAFVNRTTIPLFRSLVNDSRLTSNVVKEGLDKLPIIHVKATFNNTMYSITDCNGRVFAWTSAGSEGFHNARKGTTFAAETAGQSAAKKAIALGFKRVRVKIKGIGPGRQSSLKGLEAGGLDIAVIQDVTPIPFNGCRPKKARRI